mmetsp:Transcript_6320/g.5923  ORF Transcript_6320/g.5923 Transcript_6320/m.5923 type:complete len:82 (-) Transcript_6320:561-806(-)
MLGKLIEKGGRKPDDCTPSSSMGISLTASKFKPTRFEFCGRKDVLVLTSALSNEGGKEIGNKDCTRGMKSIMFVAMGGSMA